MTQKLRPLIDALHELGKAVSDAAPDETTLHDRHGWNFPALNKLDLPKFADRVAERLNGIDDSELNAKFDPSPLVARVVTCT